MRVIWAGLLAALFWGSAHAEPPRLPWQPELAVKQEPGLCGPLLSLMRRKFRSDQFFLRPSAADWHGLKKAGIELLPWPPVESVEESRASFQRIPLKSVVATDDGLARMDLVQIRQRFNSADVAGVAIVDASTNLAALSERALADVLFKHGLPRSELKLIENRWVPYDTDFDWPILWHRGALFLVQGDPDLGVSSPSLFVRDHFAVARIRESGLSDPVCVFRMRPLPAPNQLYGGASLAEHDPRVLSLGAVSVPGGVRAFADLLMEIHGGSAPSPSGDRRMRDGWEQQFVQEVVWRLLLRPWILAAADGSSATKGARNFQEVRRRLGRWALEGISQNRRFRDFDATLREAEQQLAAHFTKAHGYAARRSAEMASRAVRAATEMVFSGFGDELPLSHRLRFFEAVLTGQSTDMVLGAYDRAYGARDPKDWDPIRGLADPPLATAIERPDLFDVLIQRGADVNAVNGFGKTALMYAAQFDLIESVKLLLARGAKVNLTTDARKNWTFVSLTRDQRSALFYAAENASEDLIVALLDGGANAAHRDSRNNSVLAYLAKNQRLDSEARERVERRLLERGATP